MTGRFAIASAVGLLTVMGVVLWWFTRPVPVVAPTLSLTGVTFADLPGWSADDHAAALGAFKQSCHRIERWPDDRPLDRAAIGGRVGDWRPACQAATAVPADDPGAARRFFEQWFRPYAARFAGTADGLFTGYYEPLLHGSLRADVTYRIPLYRRPDDLVTVDLADFAEDLKGRAIVGRVDRGRLLPYPDRAAIDGGALANRGIEIVYVDDPVDAFFLHIQGSGVVQLRDGRELRVGYAAKNGRPYFAIGRTLIERGHLDRENVSMQSIRAWLAEHPDEAMAVMQLNPSYVFFREITGPGPLGSLGVPLTPGRSIAVDREHIPLGIPVWLDTTRPTDKADAEPQPLRRLMLAQDTGGAIRGGVRGDVFWGAGADAAYLAGHMKQPGRWYLLLPAAPTS